MSQLSQFSASDGSTDPGLVDTFGNSFVRHVFHVYVENASETPVVESLQFLLN